jgi:chromosome segregation ATPase
MSEKQDETGKESGTTGAEESAGPSTTMANIEEDVIHTDPRLPWEVSPRTVRSDTCQETRRNRSAAHFAEAGKIDVLAKIDSLRNEMNRLYRDRELRQDRATELEEELDRVRKRTLELQERNLALEQEKADWRSERKRLLDQVAELQERLESAETDYAELADQLESARTTIVAFGEALDRHENTTLRDKRSVPEEKHDPVE